MNQVANKLRYFIYARKSSESEDRQVQSIDDQLNRLKLRANDLGLEVKKIYTESKSAKKPNNRPLFDEMLRRIEEREADGILCWHINRLSRNPIDSGRLSWMLQQGILKSIQTVEREHLPDDNVLLFNVESGMANQYILDLKKAVKRGTDSKLIKGWRPGSAPEGYLNSKIKERGENDILVDEERFPLIRKMWDLLLTGSYSTPQILNIANNQWGYKVRKTKRKGGGPLSRTAIYKIFTNPFYAGIFYWGRDKTLYEGKHKRMITLEEYDVAQKILGRKGKQRPKTHHFAFTGAIHCAECGCLYTAVEKEKFIKSTGKIKNFTYYFCTRRRKGVKCSQKKTVPKEKLELQIEQEIEKYTILPEFLHWAIEILKEGKDQQNADKNTIYETQQKAMTQAQTELDELTKMRYRLLIDDETFLKEKKDIQTKISQIKQKLGESESKSEKWLELTERTFKFAAYARKAFATEGLELRREILRTLGRNPVIRGEKLIIEPNEWFVPIIKEYPAIQASYLRLEPAKMGDFKNKTELLGSVSTRWRGRRDLNP